MVNSRLLPESEVASSSATGLPARAQQQSGWENRGNLISKFAGAALTSNDQRLVRIYQIAELVSSVVTLSLTMNQERRNTQLFAFPHIRLIFKTSFLTFCDTARADPL